MADLVREATPVARKTHRCDDCQRFIERGTRYRRAFIVDGGDAWSWVSHQDCADLAWAVHQESHGRYADEEEMTPLIDEEPEYLDAFRGKFPHAVCRVEYSHQIAEIRNEDRLAAYLAARSTPALPREGDAP